MSSSVWWARPANHLPTNHHSPTRCAISSKSRGAGLTHRHNRAKPDLLPVVIQADKGCLRVRSRGCLPLVYPDNRTVYLPAGDSLSWDYNLR